LQIQELHSSWIKRLQPVANSSSDVINFSSPGCNNPKSSTETSVVNDFKRIVCWQEDWLITRIWFSQLESDDDVDCPYANIVCAKNNTVNMWNRTGIIIFKG